MTSSPESILIETIDHPVVASVRPPGSKSITNRALVIAAVANGQSRLTNVLQSQDTHVMIDSLDRLGINVQSDQDDSVFVVDGCNSQIPAEDADLWLENSGTSIRFLTAMCSSGKGRFRLDGNTRMRERPIGDLGTALMQIGVQIDYEQNPGFPPLVVTTPGIPGGRIQVAGDLSSQYLSGLLMAAPLAENPVTIEVAGELVSLPYVEMTLQVMRSFGVEAERTDEGHFEIAPQTYQACNYAIEPDASAASYFFALAAITGGRVTVPGLNRDALQGDVKFAEVLEQMGCTVSWDSDSITVTGGRLTGIEIDMNAISDTAQTLAAVAVFADGPTTIRNVEHMRHKETDRVSAVVTELKRMGISVEEFNDGMRIYPGEVSPATIETYDDHRMAMSFALIGLKHKGIRIADPSCTGKTFPDFFQVLTEACAEPS